MCAVPSASPCLPTPSLSVCRPEVQKTCDVFVFCLRAQLGICREAVCISHLPIAGRQAGGCSGPPCGAGLHRLSGHRSGCVTHLGYAGLECVSVFLLVVCMVCTVWGSAHTRCTHLSWNSRLVLLLCLCHLWLTMRGHHPMISVSVFVQEPVTIL